MFLVRTEMRFLAFLLPLSFFYSFLFLIPDFFGLGGRKGVGGLLVAGAGAGGGGGAVSS